MFPEPTGQAGRSHCTRTGSSMPYKANLNVSATPKLTALTADKLHAARRCSVSGAVRPVLPLLQDQKRREGLVRKGPTGTAADAW